MVTISIYLLKGPRLSYLEPNQCWSMDDTVMNHFEISDSDYTEWAVPLNSPLRKMSVIELEERGIDSWSRSMLRKNKWPFYSMSREASDALEHLQQITHGFEAESGALLYVNHPYTMIDNIARNILTYGHESVAFAYGKGENKVKYSDYDPQLTIVGGSGMPRTFLPAPTPLPLLVGIKKGK